MIKPNFTLGAIYMLLAFFTLAIMGALAKVASAYAPTTVIVFVQNLVSLFLIIPFVLHNGIAQLKTKRLHVHFVRAITGAGAWFCLFEAIRLVSLKMGILLCYAAPLWMPIIAILYFKEKIFAKVWYGVIVGFLGIVLILGVTHIQALNVNGLIMGAISGVLLAITLISVKLLNQTEKTSTILFYYSLISTLIFIPLAWPDFHMMTMKSLPCLIAIGFCLMISQVFLIAAYACASAVRLGPFVYSIIIFSAIIDWAIWHNPITPIEVLGMILVIGGGVFSMKAPKESKV